MKSGLSACTQWHTLAFTIVMMELFTSEQLLHPDKEVQDHAVCGESVADGNLGCAQHPKFQTRGQH
jgi:hypothetical protein